MKKNIFFAKQIKLKILFQIAVPFIVVIGFLLADSKTAHAHCDTLDGPVVVAARKALEAGNPNAVLIWIQKKDESEIKEVFQKTLAVRKLGGEARELADRYFFETLVRIHRAGEGESFTGLKPAGSDLGPAIPAADKALETGKVEPVIKIVMTLGDAGIRQHFREAMAKRQFDKNDVKAGREYVERYVQFIHYVERLYQDAKGQVHGHYDERALQSDEHHKM